MFVAIHLPEFPLQAVLRHAPELWEQPMALTSALHSKPQILHCTPSAQAAGVCPGMTPSQALARCGELILRQQSAGAENTARAALLDCGASFSPWVEDSAPGLCTIEIKGAQPSLEAMAELSAEMVARLAALHLQAQIGLAPNPDFALLAASRSASDTFPHAWRSVRDARELADLPIQVLEPSPQIAEVLWKWGIRTLGAFVALGREALAERLGPEVLPMFDRASGRMERPLRCIPPPESFEEIIEFEHEIETLEPLLFMLRRFLEQIAARLEGLYLVAAEIKLKLTFSAAEPTEAFVCAANGSGDFHSPVPDEPSLSPRRRLPTSDYARVFKVPSPTRDVDVLFRMLHTSLESFRAEHPIVGLQLVATPSRPARQQFGLFETALRDPNQFYETLARLGAVVGHDRVGTPALEPTHCPDAFRLVPANFMESPRAACVAALPLGLTLRRLRPPVPAEVRKTAAAGCGPAGVSLRVYEPAPLDSQKNVPPDVSSHLDGTHPAKLPEQPPAELHDLPDGTHPFADFAAAAASGALPALRTQFLTGEITAVYGPMITSGHWWDGRAWSRQEWDVQLCGELICRVYQQETGEWFLEGIYD